MSQLSVVLQDSVRTQTQTQTEPTTILGLLSQQMDGAHSATRRRRSFKERFGFIGMGCCGAKWGFPSDALSVTQVEQPQQAQAQQGMNLAAALAAERQLRGQQVEAGAVRSPGTPWRVSLMRLLEESEGGDGGAVVKEKEKEKGGGVVGSDCVCCVCMGRKKGAAFIPCGHTFCRVCSRELWLNRGSCPLCNRSILEILDIF